MVYAWCVERLSTEDDAREKFDMTLEEEDSTDMRSRRGEDKNYEALQAFAAQSV